MRIRPHIIPCSFTALSLAAAAAALSTSAWGAGPDVKSWFPAGSQRGASVEVTVNGNFPEWPVQAWVGRPGVTLTPEGDKGKFKAAIAADAIPGLYWIRLYDSRGAAPPQPFIVGTLAEIAEQEPNNEPAKAQPISSPSVVVNGQLGVAGDVDVFAVSLQKGQTLVASLEAHETLGSPFDGVLQIVAPRGNVVAFNHDQHGLDPQIALVAPADGTYFVRLFGFPSTPNSTIALAGSSQYVYRLTLTTGGFIDYPWPLAVTRGRETRVELFGWNIPEALKTVLIRPETEQAEIFDLQLANVATLAVEPHNTIAELEPNAAATPQPIELDVTVSGRIENRHDVDVFRFAAKKAEPLVFQVESRMLGYPLDAVLEVSDATGKVLSRVDDTNNTRDAVLAFSPPEDGMYRIAVSDLNHQGSPRHVYRLRATKAQADFDCSADAQAYELAAGKPSEITLTITRRNGFAEEIAFKATGLPDFVTAATALSAGTGDSAKTVKLVLSAGQGSFSGPIRIIGESTGSRKLVRTAGVTIPGRTARTSDLWLTVLPPAAK
ncbi:MAG: PPC domain-containing protein [Planctomycetia bacterium]|nr:PPC domain-containing protein [Planctomycetia bacterium]